MTGFAALRPAGELPGMNDVTAVRFFFDYLDPLSYLLDGALKEAAGDPGATVDVVRVPLELRPPPAPLLDPDGPWWRKRWAEAEAVVRELGTTPLVEPAILPWTRKAHELVAHARAKGKGDEAHQAVFDALFRQGRDIGRVDVLLEIGRTLELDATETKAVLDVDRYAEAVAEQRTDALRAAGAEPPVLLRDGQVLRGFHNRDRLRTFLLR